MQWEQLSASDFARAVKRTGVCIVPMGVMEKHADHLPLGTDMLASHRLACLAAVKEPAVVFPPFYFGQIFEARCFPGTLTIKPTLLLELLEAVLDDIGRNGFKKIILFNGHGGNNALLMLLAQSSLWRQKPYSVYVVKGAGGKALLTPQQVKQWDAMMETPYHGHACECETSISLALHPELVKMNRVRRRGGAPLNRLAAIPAAFTGIGWYADHPEHYAGDARPATASKGAKLVGMIVDGLSRFIADVKADKIAPALEREFFRRANGLARARHSG